jgi:K+-transporting ATPase A subunit
MKKLLIVMFLLGMLFIVPKINGYEIEANQKKMVIVEVVVHEFQNCEREYGIFTKNKMKWKEYLTLLKDENNKIHRCISEQLYLITKLNHKYKINKNALDSLSWNGCIQT